MLVRSLFRTDQTQAPPLLLAVVSVFMLSSVGCRSKLDVHAQNGVRDPNGGIAKPDTVEVRGSKQVFQSRDTVTIDINPTLLKGAPKFSVVNLSTDGASASNPRAVVQGSVPNLGLADDGSFSLASDPDETKLTLSFYPGDKSFKDKFSYGTNTLRILALDPGSPRYSTIEFTLYDFDIFDVASSGFTENVQVETGDSGDDYQFQGWMNTVGPAQTYVSDGSTLTTGYFDIINPH